MSFPSWKSTLERMAEHLTALLPGAVAAVGLLLVGWLMASLLRMLARKLVVAVIVRINTHFRHTEGLLGTRMTEDAPRVVGAFVYWVVLLFFLAAAIEKLPLPIVTSALQSIAYYVPKILLAVVIIFIGLGAGTVANRWTARVAAAAGVEFAPALGRIAQVAILIVALSVGSQEIGLESEFFTATILIVLATILGGLALAFGLGSSPVVTNIMASYYAAQVYRVGDVVRVGDIEGTVREIRTVCIVLDTADGQVHLPARKYCDDISIVSRKE